MNVDLHRAQARPRRVRAVPNLLRWVVALSALNFAAALEAQQTAQGTNSEAAKREAIRSISVEGLSPDDLARVRYVLNNTSIYRQMSVKTIKCDKDLFLFLLRNPEVVTETWKMMGASQVELGRPAPNFFTADDRAGTTGSFKVIKDSGDQQLVYVEGTYEGKLMLNPLKARCLIIQSNEFTQTADGVQLVTSKMDAFIQLDNVSVEFLAKTLQPLMGRNADYNFVETMKFLSEFSSTAATNPEGVERLSNKLRNVSPEVRNGLVAHSQMAATRR